MLERPTQKREGDTSAAPAELNGIATFSIAKPWCRYFLIAVGWISVSLGLIGAVLPLLPTTPFLLLAAACFARSSPRFYHWLHTNPFFGEYLRRYRSGEGIPLRAKIMTISLLWLTLATSAFWVVPAHYWYVRLGLALLGLAVTFHLLRIRTRIS